MKIYNHFFFDYWLSIIFKKIEHFSNEQRRRLNNLGNWNYYYHFLFLIWFDLCHFFSWSHFFLGCSIYVIIIFYYGVYDVHRGHRSNLIYFQYEKKSIIIPDTDVMLVYISYIFIHKSFIINTTEINLNWKWNTVASYFGVR